MHRLEPPQQTPAAITTPVPAPPEVTTITTGLPEPDWLTIEFRHLGVLATDEYLVSRPSEAWPACKLTIIGPGYAYHGRICGSAAGLYRLNPDGSDAAGVPLSVHDKILYGIML